jgi:hypothetical protein
MLGAQEELAAIGSRGGQPPGGVPAGLVPPTTQARVCQP